VQRLSFQGPHNGHCSENDRARREDNKDREHDESLASTSIALTPSLCKGLSVKDPAEHPQGVTQIGTQKMNMSLDIYPNISHKNLSCNIICTDVKKLIYTACIFAYQSVGEI
jgi:hypothetical protein